MYDLVTKEQFKDILLDCEIDGITLKQVMVLVGRLN